MQSKTCVVVGSPSVGKRTLIVTLSKDELENMPTIVDNCLVRIRANEKDYTFNMIDTSGQERYDCLRRLSLKHADVLVVCFSVTEPESFDDIREKWLPEIKDHCPDTPFLIVGTKVDLRNDTKVLRELVKKQQKPVAKEVGETAAEQWKAVGYLECSALKKKGLKELSEALIKAIEHSEQKRGCVIQ